MSEESTINEIFLQEKEKELAVLRERCERLESFMEEIAKKLDIEFIRS